MQQPELGSKDHREHRRCSAQSRQNRAICQQQEDSQGQPCSGEAHVVRRVEEASDHAELRVECPSLAECGIPQIPGHLHEQEHRGEHHQDVIAPLAGCVQEVDRCARGER